MNSVVEQAIEVRGVVKRYGPVTALAQVDLSVGKGEFFCLLGPSGCGKTTLLRILAGLSRCDEGTIRIAGRDAAAVPAHLRPVNTVFQSYALFPHLNVTDNIGFGLRMKRVPKPELCRRVDRIMDLMQIGRLAGRMPGELSGGEKQRVALARAVVNEPEILLLDEPLGALDLKLRKELQAELHSLQRRLGITFVYVTHDQDEALTLSDRIAVLRGGKVEQIGTGKDLYERPCNRFVAGFLGECNFLEATVDGAHRAETPLGGLRVSAIAGVRGKVTLAARPERLTLSAGSDAANTVDAVVRGATYNGSESRFAVEACGQLLRVTQLNASGCAAWPGVGDRVKLTVPEGALVVLSD